MLYNKVAAGGGTEDRKIVNTDSLPKLSIIIISYNTCDITDDCLESIYSAQWRSDFEVIVVDNASCDGSVSMIREKYPQVRLIANSENRLFSCANNQGAEIACGEYMLLLNSDTIIKDDNLQRMVDFFDTLPDDVICIGPKVINRDGSLQSFGWALPSLSERFCMCFKIYRIVPFVAHFVPGLPVYPDRIREVGWVVGACMMIRAGLYRKVGGLNERIEFYGEEQEFGYRTRKRFGLRTIYYPDASVIHLGGASTKNGIGISKTEEDSLRRYAKIQQETVGYTRAILMSRLVLCGCYLKWVVSSNKKYIADAISYEKKVIKYLQYKIHEERTASNGR